MTSTAELSSPESAKSLLTHDVLDTDYTLEDKYRRTQGRIYLRPACRRWCGCPGCSGCATNATGWIPPVSSASRLAAGWLRPRTVARAQASGIGEGEVHPGLNEDLRRDHGLGIVE